MNTVTLSVATLVDRALEELRNQYEVGRPVVRAAAINAVETTFTLNVSANVSDVLEFSTELMLVTAKSPDATPVYTVIRGYFKTQALSHSGNQPGLLNPTFTRKAAVSGVQRSLPAIEATEGLEFLRTEQYTAVADPFDTTSGRLVIGLPSETRDVWYVRDGLQDVPRTRFYDNVATSVYATGKVLTLPLGWDIDWPVLVTRQVPYRFSSHPADPDEQDTIELPEGAEYLPSAYSTAWVLAGREVSRTELDRSEEFSRSEPSRGGVSASVVRDKWQAFYRKLDEARRLNPPLPARPYVARYH